MSNRYVFAPGIAANVVIAVGLFASAIAFGLTADWLLVIVVATVGAVFAVHAVILWRKRNQ